jgi:hypothetical protein
MTLDYIFRLYSRKINLQDFCSWGPLRYHRKKCFFQRVKTIPGRKSRHQIVQDLIRTRFFVGSSHKIRQYRMCSFFSRLHQILTVRCQQKSYKNQTVSNVQQPLIWNVSDHIRSDKFYVEWNIYGLMVGIVHDHTRSDTNICR